MERQGDGLDEDVWPFSFTGLIASITTVCAIFALAFVGRDDEFWMRLWLGTTSFFFVWTLLSVLALLDLVAGYGAVRTSHWRKTDGRELGDGGPDDGR